MSLNLIMRCLVRQALVLKNIQSKLNKTASGLLSNAVVRAEVLLYSLGYHHTAYEV